MTASESRVDSGERVLRVAVPAGMAVFTWLAGLVIAGYLVRLRPLTVPFLVDLVVTVLLLWPLAAFVPWRDGLTRRLRNWARRRRRALAVTAALAGAAGVLPVVGGPEPLVTALRLPSESVGLYGIARLYREHAGATLAWVLVRFGRGYLQALWLYVLASALLGAAGRVTRD